MKRFNLSLLAAVTALWASPLVAQDVIPNVDVNPDAKVKSDRDVQRENFLRLRAGGDLSVSNTMRQSLGAAGAFDFRKHRWGETYWAGSGEGVLAPFNPSGLASKLRLSGELGSHSHDDPEQWVSGGLALHALVEENRNPRGPKYGAATVGYRATIGTPYETFVFRVAQGFGEIHDATRPGIGFSGSADLTANISKLLGKDCQGEEQCVRAFLKADVFQEAIRNFRVIRYGGGAQIPLAKSHVVDASVIVTDPTDTKTDVAINGTYTYQWDLTDRILKARQAR